MKEYVHFLLPDGQACTIFTAHIECIKDETGGKSCSIILSSGVTIKVQGERAAALSAIYNK